MPGWTAEECSRIVRVRELGWDDRCARRALVEMGRWAAPHAAMRKAMDQTNEADDCSYRLAWDLLVTVRTKAEAPMAAEAREFLEGFSSTGGRNRRPLQGRTGDDPGRNYTMRGPAFS